MTILSIENVTKRYGEAVILDSISLSVEERTITCLIGPSGSGKSTLLRCVNRLESIQGGEIYFKGENIAEYGANHDRVRREVGMIFQSYNLFPNMTVLKNITLAPRKTKRVRPDEAAARALTLLDRIGLRDKADAYPGQLSGGQQQRVAIARALAMEPKVLLLDEVTSALDPELVGEVLDLIRELAAEHMTMIMATHEMRLVREIADKVCFLDGGRIVEEGPPSQVIDAPLHDRTRRFVRRSIEER